MRCLGIGGVADSKIYAPPPNNVKFGTFATKGVRINRKEPPKLGSDGAPPPCGRSVASPPVPPLLSAGIRQVRRTTLHQLQLPWPHCCGAGGGGDIRKMRSFTLRTVTGSRRRALMSDASWRDRAPRMCSILLALHRCRVTWIGPTDARNWAFTRYDRRTDWSVRPRLRPTVCQTSRTDRSDRL